MSKAEPQESHLFYRLAMQGLCLLEAREQSGRRFGPDADSRWDEFKGQLQISDRIDLLLRDAAVRWGAAFAPARAFDLPGVANDEPFGADWQPLDEAQAHGLWWQWESLNTDIESMAQSLGWTGARLPLQDLGERDRLLLSGVDAITSAILTFASQPDLSWSRQVVVITADWRQRQLAGLGALVLDAQHESALFSPPPQDKSGALDKALQERHFYPNRCLVSGSSQADLMAAAAIRELLPAEA